jgi:molybdopterin/thiamine biosynthesis adenylyltransferase
MTGIVVVGLGGVGSILIERLCRFLNFSNEAPPHILLVDGDEYEIKNYERQEFTRLGNKADIKAGELSMKFNKLIIDAWEDYIDEGNVSDVIESGNIVFMCVDNHKTRKIISNYCKTMEDITLISGGNDLTDGNVQFYVRENGKDLTCDLCKYHPEIANPEDKLPTEMSCEELSMSEPQLYFANLGVATIMCWTYYNVVVKKDYDPTKSEVYFDLRACNAQSQTRLV